MPASVRPRIGLDVRLTYYTAGGIAKYIRRLAEQLPTLAPGHDYTHFYRRRHRETYSTLAKRVDCLTPAHHRLERWSLALELLPHRLDLLHSPDFIPPLAGYRRSVITVHDLTFLLYPRFLTPDSRRYYNDQIAWAVRKADAISADSHATKQDLVNLLSVPPDKITVIHLGLDPEYSLPPAPAGGSGAARLAELGLTAGYILFVGTFEPRKNVAGLLSAYARLRARAPDLPPLVLAGRRGWLFDDTAALVHELRLDDCVRFLVEWSAADGPLLYQSASLFVLPSHYEGFGFTVLEAMASGTPAIIANRASLPEIAGDAALKVDPDQPDEIAQVMLTALTDTALRDSLVRKGIARSRRFTWAATAQATLDLYERTLAS